MSNLVPKQPALDQLKPWQLVAFCAAITERMLPNFMLFAKLAVFGDAQQVRRILDGVWAFLGTDKGMNFEVQLAHVEANIPSEEDFDMYGVMPAMDSIVALYSTLVCIIEKDSSEAQSVAILSRESVVNFITINLADPEQSEDELAIFISQHPLMQDEDAFQEEVYSRIVIQQQSNKHFLQDLRLLATNEGVSNLGIEAIDD